MPCSAYWQGRSAVSPCGTLNYTNLRLVPLLASIVDPNSSTSVTRPQNRVIQVHSRWNSYRQCQGTDLSTSHLKHDFDYSPACIRSRGREENIYRRPQRSSILSTHLNISLFHSHVAQQWPTLLPETSNSAGLTSRRPRTHIPSDHFAFYYAGLTSRIDIVAEMCHRPDTCSAELCACLRREKTNTEYTGGGRGGKYASAVGIPEL